MGFGFERYHGVDVGYIEIVGAFGILWCELFDSRTFHECDIVLVSRYEFVGVYLGCALNHLE